MAQTDPVCDGCPRELDLMRDLSEARREYEGPMAEEISLWKREAEYWKRSALLQCDATRFEFERANYAAEAARMLAHAIEQNHSPGGAECVPPCDLCTGLAMWIETVDRDDQQYPNDHGDQ